jgi:hypothetical protein
MQGETGTCRMEEPCMPTAGPPTPPSCAGAGAAAAGAAAAAAPVCISRMWNWPSAHRGAAAARAWLSVSTFLHSLRP